MRWIVCLGIAAGVLAAAGCDCRPGREETEPVITMPQEFLKKKWQPQEVPAAHIVRRDYRLREGDSLEIIYHVRHQKEKTYKIQIQDKLFLRFPFNPSLNQVEEVQSDGMVYLDLVGPIPVLGKTVETVDGVKGVRQILTEEYSKFIKDPVLTVSFKESKIRINKLIEAIRTAPRGMSRLVPITPDGTISLPFIVTVRAAGLTVEELHKVLNDAYKAVDLSELEVTVNVQNVSPRRVYVLGEVRIPGALQDRTGAISSAGDITLLQALAQSGSYIPARAELSRVALIRRRNLPRPQIAIINVRQLLENHTRAGDKPAVADSGKHRYDIWLEDGDIVYVPTSDIAKRADYIDYVWTRGIRAVGGFTSQASYSATDAVDWLGPNP